MRFMLYQVLTVAAATLASATGALASDALDAHLAQLDAKVRALGSKADLVKSKPVDEYDDEEAEAARYRAKLAGAKKNAKQKKDIEDLFDFDGGANFEAAEKLMKEIDDQQGPAGDKSQSMRKVLHCVCGTVPDPSSVPVCASKADISARFSAASPPTGDELGYTGVMGPCYEKTFGKRPVPGVWKPGVLKPGETKADWIGTNVYPTRRYDDTHSFNMGMFYAANKKILDMNGIPWYAMKDGEEHIMFHERKPGDSSTAGEKAAMEELMKCRATAKNPGIDCLHLGRP